MSVTYELQDNVAVVTFDDGKANAINLGVLEELKACLDRAGTGPEAGALVIAGRPGRLSAGFDLAAMTASESSMKELVMAGGRFVARLLLEPRPVVVACTGHALAAGAFLLLAADHRIGAAGEWKIGLNEVTIGMAMPVWGVELATYRLSPNHLAGSLVLGQVVSPDEAKAAGFLDRVAPADRVVDEARATAKKLAELRGSAVGGTKRRARAALVERMLEDIEADLDSITVPQAPAR